MMQQKVTPRKSNIELYRVIVMLLIIAHHYVVNSGLMAADGPIYGDLLSLRSQFFLIFGAFGKTGINCFTLITGYFMCFSKISLRKYVKLLFQIEFYKIVLFLIFLAFGRESVSLMRIVKLLLPAFGLGTGYVGSFVLYSGDLSCNCRILWRAKAYKDTFIPVESGCNAPILVGTAQEKGRRRCV